MATTVTPSSVDMDDVGERDEIETARDAVIELKLSQLKQVRARHAALVEDLYFMENASSVFMWPLDRTLISVPDVQSAAQQFISERSLPGSSFLDTTEPTPPAAAEEEQAVELKREVTEPPEGSEAPAASTDAADVSESADISEGGAQVDSADAVPVRALLAPSPGAGFGQGKVLDTTPFFQGWKALSVHHSQFVLLRGSKRIVTTDDWLAARQERKTTYIVQRIEELRKANAWSLRQLKRWTQPPRYKSPWDNVLEEAEWLAVDMYEERRWKMAAACVCAHLCLRYFAVQNKREVLKPFRIPGTKKNSFHVSRLITSPIDAAPLDITFPEWWQGVDWDNIEVDLFCAAEDFDAVEGSVLAPPAPLEPEDVARADQHGYMPIVHASRISERVWNELCAKRPHEASPEPIAKRIKAITEEPSMFDSEAADGDSQVDASEAEEIEKLAHPSSSSSTAGAPEPSPAPAAPPRLRKPEVDWTPLEDQRLLEYSTAFGMQWNLVAQSLNRTAENCRERFNRIQSRDSDAKVLEDMSLSFWHDPEPRGPFTDGGLASLQSTSLSTPVAGGLGHKELANKYLSSFEFFIQKANKTGTAANKSVGWSSGTAASAQGGSRPTRKISLAAHDSHAAVIAEIGYNPAKPLQPAELAQRRLAAIAKKQAAAAAAANESAAAAAAAAAANPAPHAAAMAAAAAAAAQPRPFKPGGLIPPHGQPMVGGVIGRPVQRPPHMMAGAGVPMGGRAPPPGVPSAVPSYSNVPGQGVPVRQGQPMPQRPGMPGGVPVRAGGIPGQLGVGGMQRPQYGAGAVPNPAAQPATAAAINAANAAKMRPSPVMMQGRPGGVPMMGMPQQGGIIAGSQQAAAIAAATAAAAAAAKAGGMGAAGGMKNVPAAGMMQQQHQQQHQQQQHPHGDQMRKQE